MNSKQALDHIKHMADWEYYDIKDDILPIEKDLERLEKLEKENQELKEKYKILEENEESVLTTLEISVQENAKLKKVIETLKQSLLLSVGELRGIYYVLAYENNYCMTKEEYDLLKEVLEDE